MPQTTERHCSGNRDPGSPQTVAAAPERNVKVGQQKTAKRYVPPALEFANACSFVGREKIDRQADAEHEGKTDGHIRIA